MVATTTVGNDKGGLDTTYHKTVVVRTYGNGDIRLNSGGWKTATTKSRMNKFTPDNVHVWQKNYEWYVTIGETVLPFEDNMVFNVRD